MSRDQPDQLVIVDAAIMGLEPGAVRRLPIQANDRMLASTHGLPLSFVPASIESAASATILIGIEPTDLSFGEGLSSVVETAAQALIELLCQKDLDRIPKHEIPL